MADLSNQFKQIISFIRTPIHPAGWPFIAGAAGITALFAMLSGILGFIGLVLSLWVIYFFRDPNRVVPAADGIIVAPADGIITNVNKTNPPVEMDMGGEPVWHISIFMSVFDVHVNRAPMTGSVSHIDYIEGEFINATLDKASKNNERICIKIEDEAGHEIGLQLIAGLIARRIVCDLDIGDEVTIGDKIGIIRFGSRADIYLPRDVVPNVAAGQTMIGGETILADRTSDTVDAMTAVTK